MRTAQLKPSMSQNIADDIAEMEAAALAAVSSTSTTTPTPTSTPVRVGRGRDDSAEAAAALAAVSAGGGGGKVGGEEPAAAAAALPPCWVPLLGTNVYKECPPDQRRWIDDAREGAAAAEADEDRTKRLVTQLNENGRVGGLGGGRLNALNAWRP